MAPFVPKKLMWWYPAIADQMLANPGGSASSIAAALDRHENTIRVIMSSDLFKEYFAERRREHEEGLRLTLNSKLGQVAERGLDLILDRMEKKRDQIPFTQLESVTGGALAKLGYDPKPGPSVVVDARQQHNTQVTIAPPVDVATLEAARAALRVAQQARSAAPSLPAPVPPSNGDLEGVGSAEVEYNVEDEVDHAPIAISA